MPPYHLLAFSLGGMVAVAWARHHPEECRALVLLNTSLGPYDPFHQRLRPRALPATLTALAFRGTVRERAILRFTTARWAELGSVLPDWLAWARECPVSRGNVLRQLLAAARFSAPERPATELLILAGARDNLADPRCSRQLAAAWTADFALHPHAGHDLPLDDGRWVVARMGEWLAGRGSHRQVGLSS